MRNYDALELTYFPNQRTGEKIDLALPSRAVREPGRDGVNETPTYFFEPCLTKDEIKGLTEILVDLNVKKFTFIDIQSMGKKD